MARLKTAVPKPKPRKPKAKRPISRSRPRPVNKKRKAANHARAYGGEYADWIRSLPCCACGVSGFTEAAHTTTGGMARKADASTVVPLCGPHFIPPEFLYNGCHSELHRVGPDSWPFKPIDLKAKAADLWREYSENRGPTA